MIVARRPLRGTLLFAASLAALACTRSSADANAKADSTKVAAAAAANTVHVDSVSRAPFGTAPDGTPVEVFTLTNKNGVETRILSYGGIIQSLRTPDKIGQGRRRRARLRRPRRLREELALLRRHRRPLRQPHRARALHPRRQDLHARDQQPAEQPARRRRRDSTRSSGTPSRSRATAASASSSPTRAPTATKVSRAR